MGGRTLKFQIPDNENVRHDVLINREIPLQHPLQASYRDTDGKDLDALIKELETSDRTVHYEEVDIIIPNSTIVTLTKFDYNLAKDVLYVSVGGLQAFEGTDNDFVKLSPTQIQFNYPLPNPITIGILLLGTISSKSFGSDVYSMVNKFTQLVDTPKQYLGSEGKYARVNESGTGLIFDTVKASNSLVCIEHITGVTTGSFSEGWINLAKSGIIKGIKVTGIDSITKDYVDTGDIKLSIKTGPYGEWIYYSGTVSGILWDIMDIPFIDESGMDSVYLKLESNGPDGEFKIQIYILL